MLIVVQTIHDITSGQGETDHAKIFESHFVKFGGFRVLFFPIFLESVGRAKNSFARLALNRFEALK